MDLRWQIEIGEADRSEKTAFVLPRKAYTSHAVRSVICDLRENNGQFATPFKWTMCLCYLDDIIVFSERPSYTIKTCSKNRLRKSGINVVFRGVEEVEAFNSLKKALTSDPVLRDVRRKRFYRNPILMQVGTVSEQSGIQNNVESYSILRL
ncbi:hypothetical protein TNIN_312481 [Trichonephila inaurata madagascariensis]|uniref:Uncharacterized protein n=1 Tax=Trichonephila inaurata madagascariensis TaxID=2747483 RepID=A0A8X6YIZ7_9ARAC|nr:hypothetical protein TNIN_312481 [Trichonephila inaurata madagascariensis]